MLGMSTQHSLHAALETSDRRFRRLVETATEGIWFVDADARINFANARMAEMLGCSVPDLTGRSVFEFVPAERVGTELKLVARAIGALAGARSSYCDGWTTARMCRYSSPALP